MYFKFADCFWVVFVKKATWISQRIYCRNRKKLISALITGDQWPISPPAGITSSGVIVIVIKPLWMIKLKTYGSIALWLACLVSNLWKDVDEIKKTCADHLFFLGDMILVWVQNFLWCDNTHDVHNYPIKVKQRRTTKITGLSALDTEASLLLYMPLLPPCTLERLGFVFSVGSKSLTIVHAHPSHFITTSELILEDFRESQANFASETLIFLSTAEHEMTIKLMNNISRTRWPFPLDSPSSSLSMLQFYTSWEHLNECVSPLNTLHSNARPKWPWPRDQF